MADIRAIPGLGKLWELTKGDERICVAVVDGIVDNGHPAFRGAALTHLPGVGSQDSFGGVKAAHGTHVASVIFGQSEGPVPGVAPGCRGLSVPAFSDRRRRTSQLEIARGIELAVEAGAHIVNVSGGQLSPEGRAQDPLGRAVQHCTDNNVLVVAAVGNNGCFCNQVPAALDPVLAVGALDDDGQPLAMSNWGPAYRGHGILAPGENIIVAVPGGQVIKRSGTSLAAPIVTGVAALLLSLQVQQGLQPDPSSIGALLVETASPCEVEDPGAGDGTGPCERFLSGTLNIGRAMTAVTESLETVGQSSSACGCGGHLSFEPDATAAPMPTAGSAAARGVWRSAAPASDVSPGGVEPSTDPGSPGPGSSSPVYALGALGFDFGSDARRDTFKQLMAPVEIDGTVVPANPFDSRQMVDHLTVHPSEARSLIWTLNMELTPIYAIEAEGPYAAAVYELLTRLLAGEVAGSDAPGYVERVAIPGRVTGRTAKLHSGQLVPVIDCQQLRGLYGWEVNKLVSAAVAAARDAAGSAADIVVAANLREFLTKVYYDLRNLGVTSADRALNFAATNAFQAAHTFATALAEGRVLDTIAVEKSPFCRLDSDCWDVRLRFFDPENDRRARRVFRFTIDVSDVMPVTLGDVRTWTEAA
ncbi:MAG: PatA/PatG family cyanobactin maturation protease [Gemmatimonadales bacterium]|nr:PatA/PatG family cyanobactin maturation protease [Gemmatimonadales bacterium]